VVTLLERFKENPEVTKHVVGVELAGTINWLTRFSPWLSLSFFFLSSFFSMHGAKKI